MAPMLIPALDENARSFLKTKGIRRSFAHDQIIQQRGDKAEGVWLIESGAVIVGQFLPEGEFRSVALLGPGDSYGELALFSGLPRVVDAIARGPSELMHIPGSAVDALFAERPEAMRLMLGAMAQQLQEVLDIVAGIRRGSSMARIAAMLANLSGNAHGEARIAITQQELGELLGLTRATVSTALGELERDGVLERGYGSIRLLQPERLRLLSIS